MVNYIKIAPDALDKLLDDNDIAYTADTTRAQKVQLHKDFVAKQAGEDAPDPDADAGKEEEEEKDPGEKPTPKMEILPAKAKKSGKFREFYIVKSNIQTGEKLYVKGDKFPGYAGCEQDLAHALEI